MNNFQHGKKTSQAIFNFMLILYRIKRYINFMTLEISGQSNLQNLFDT